MILSRYFNCDSSFTVAGVSESLKTSSSSSWTFSWCSRLLPKRKSVQVIATAVVSWPYIIIYIYYSFIIIYSYYYILIYNNIINPDKKELRFKFQRFFSLTSNMNVSTCALNSSSFNGVSAFSFWSSNRSRKAFLFRLPNEINFIKNNSKIY